MLQEGVHAGRHESIASLSANWRWTKSKASAELGAVLAVESGSRPTKGDPDPWVT